MMNRKHFITFLLLVMAWPAMAQVLQPYRYERPQKNSDDYYNLISLQQDGLALFRERDKYKQNNKIWELIFLDTELNEKKVLELEIKERHKMIGYEVTAGHVFLLFRTGETSKNDFVLIDISFEGEELARHTIKPDLDFRITHFISSGSNFVLGGYVNNEPAILIYESTNNSLKVVPGFFQKNTELVDLRANLNRTFNTVLVDRSARGERKLVFRTYDETGKQLLEDDVQLDENITLQTGITSSLQREDLVVMGTWGQRNSKQSHGFYTLSVNPFADQKIQFIDFGRLNHFLDYLNPKRAQRIKQNAKDDASAGKNPGFSSYVMPFKIMEAKDGFYLLAEVYNPVSGASAYNTNPYYYNPFYSPYGYYPYWPGSGFYYPGMSRMYRPYMYSPNMRNNDDVKTLSSVVLAFDANGNVMWDQSVKLDEIKLPAIEQVADFALHNDKGFIIYKKESELKVKIFIPGSDDVNEIKEKIKPLENQDEIRSEKTHEGGVRHWYGNSFFVWGYQTIRNSTKQDRTRDVFYINRIDVE